MKYKVTTTSSFRKEVKKAALRGLDISLLESVVTELAKGSKLHDEYKNHKLKGKYKGYYECHVQPDWLLIYKIYEDKLILSLEHTGTHSELFGI